jgi:hypothetical protein
MRLHNKQRYSFFKLFYLLLGLTVLFDLVRASLDGSFGDLPMISPAIMLIGLFLIYRGLPVFEFDSDGEVLILSSKEPYLMSFNKSMFFKHSEFPKRKLRSYRIVRMPFRRVLHIAIDSKEGNQKRVKFPISYLKRNEVQDLERSLSRVLKRMGKIKEEKGNE